jgi:hypothetical protein
MPKYLAVYYETKRYERIIEAKDEDEARDIAHYSGYDDLIEDHEYCAFEMASLREIKDA